MPYKSLAQAAKFHIMEKQGKISHETVKEFDKESKGMHLPQRAKSKDYKHGMKPASGPKGKVSHSGKEQEVVHEHHDVHHHQHVHYHGYEGEHAQTDAHSQPSDMDHAVAGRLKNLASK